MSSSVAQRRFRIGDVELGGRLGELPCVLIGSVFHEGHGIVKDRSSGEFNARKARRLIREQDEVSRRTGVPCMLDVVGDTPESIDLHLDFVSQETDAPLLVNATEARVRVHGMLHARDLGIDDRVVYDSINYRIDDAEVEMIKGSGAEAAIVQAFNPRNPMPEGMVEIIRDSGGLLERATEAGITKPLLFTPVMDLPGIGMASRGISLLKEETGLPTGTAPVGVVGRSKAICSMGECAKTTCRTAAVTLCQGMGANYIIYGTVSRAPEIFPACAMIDAALRYGQRVPGTSREPSRDPLRVLFTRR